MNDLDRLIEELEDSRVALRAETKVETGNLRQFTIYVRAKRDKGVMTEYLTFLLNELRKREISPYWIDPHGKSLAIRCLVVRKGLNTG